MIVSNSIEIYLADDHEIVAKALANLILSLDGVRSIRTFPHGKALYEACLEKMPDLVILDMEMPVWNGMQTLKRLKEKSSVPVIMLTMNDERSCIEESIREGALGYLHKNSSPRELQQALSGATQGTIFLSEETKKLMVGLRQPHHPGFSKLSEPLTSKEQEVLQLVCDGLSSKEIGEKLFISPRTVETRKNNLMQKFNVQTTGRLIALAIKNKIVG